MKRLLAVLGVATLGAALSAQTLNTNYVDRNITEFHTISTGKHPNGNNYIWSGTVPAAYSASATTGVVKDTLSWRWIPSMTNLRKEDREVSRFIVGIKPSAATTTYPFTAYFPEVAMHPAKQVAGKPTESWAQGARYEPDLSKQPLTSVAAGSISLPRFGGYLVTRTLSAPVKISSEEIVLSVKWQGGEHRNVANTQNMFGDFSSGLHTPFTCGFADPQGNTTLIDNSFYVHMIGYYEEAPVVNAASDWGHRRNSSIANSTAGHSIGTYQSDLASAAGTLSWNLDCGAAHAGELAIPLLAIGPVFPIGFKVLGVTLEVNPASAVLGVLGSAGYGLTLDASGQATGPKLNFGALGSSAIGTNVGVEFVTANTQGQITGSTQAVYVNIAR